MVIRSTPSNRTAPPVTRTVRGRIPKIALATVDFPGAALPDQAARFAASDFQRNFVQDDGAIAVRDRTQLRDREYRRAHRRITGSSARRSPSPSRLKASTVKKSATSGASSTHQP